MANCSLNNPARLLKWLLGIVILMVALGCSKKESELVGLWDNVKAPEVLEFKQDGSGTFTYPNSQNPPLAFVWKQTAKNSYSLDVNFMGTKKVLMGSFKDKLFNIETNVGKEEYRKRAPR